MPRLMAEKFKLGHYLNYRGWLEISDGTELQPVLAP
jgi:hypothetical protein